MRLKVGQKMVLSQAHDEDVPENWFCPDCGAGKEDFEMVEMD